MSAVGLDALLAIGNLIGAPVASYYPLSLQLEEYELRVQQVSQIVRRAVIVLSASASIPLPPSSEV